MSASNDRTPRYEFDLMTLDTDRLMQVIFLALMKYINQLSCCDCQSTKIAVPMKAPAELADTIRAAVEAMDVGRAELIGNLGEQILDIRNTVVRLQLLNGEQKQ